MSILDLKHSTHFDIDDPRRTLQHREVILSKPFLKKIYTEWYSIFQKHIPLVPLGKWVELGSGGGFLKQVIPQVITSDILNISEIVDQVFLAQNMPFEDNSVAAIFMTNVFHHIPDSTAFLKEANRVLVPGGRIVMIEPANTWWGKFIYTKMHHEPFDVNGDWRIAESGPMSGSNQALPYIVFERDRKRFEQEFPHLFINKIEYQMPIRYILSGGVSKIQMVPSFSFGFFRVLEKLALRITKQFAMFVTIVIEKK